jgi:hypothetical protein
MHESGWGFSDTSHFSRTFKPSRSTSSVTATIPDTGVSDGSGAPIRTRRRNRRISRTLST